MDVIHVHMHILALNLNISLNDLCCLRTCGETRGFVERPFNIHDGRVSSCSSRLNVFVV